MLVMLFFTSAFLSWQAIKERNPIGVGLCVLATVVFFLLCMASTR
jgi:hypothetical protein